MMNRPAQPFILDFDNSVLQLSQTEIRLPLTDWQERLRFSCSWQDFRSFAQQVNWPTSHGCIFLGSGDYHHLSLLALEKLSETNEQFDLIVLDNHPDNMRYPFGLHCGSWVYHASRLGAVSHIHVLGITSGDIAWQHAWENHFSPFWSKKLTYWSVNQQASLLKRIAGKDSVRAFSSADELLHFFSKFSASADNIKQKRKIYLSIDKDVFSQDVVKTNWDQGLFAGRHLQQLLELCAGKIIGADVTGEISVYSYQSFFKKLLSGLDGQAPIDDQQVKSWQQEQCQFNLEIIELLKKAGYPDC